MKKIFILAISIFIVSLSACRKNETCATYAKDSRVVKGVKI